MQLHIAYLVCDKENENLLIVTTKKKCVLISLFVFEMPKLKSQKLFIHSMKDE